jgi:hypothetical protein
MPKRLPYLVLTCLLLCWRDAAAAPLFDDDSVLEFELVGPLSSIIEAGDKSREETFTLRFGGEEQPVQVRVRGKSRLRVCNFPPLRLRFDATSPASGAFAGQEKLRLVTHCRGQDKGDQNAMEEYAAYRIFSILSDYAYRVRPLRITYTDTDGKLSEKDRVRYAFAIEHSDQLVDRTGGAKLKLPAVPVSRLNRPQAGLVFVYQYLIGNTDWSLVMADGDDACCHNGDLLEVEGSIYYIPYDFDLAGIVNASYARPDPTLRMKNVRQRKYRGYCIDSTVVAEALRYVKSREQEIMQAAQGIPGLADSEKRDMSEYLGQFFKKAKHEDKLLRLYEKRCIGKKV